MLQSRGLWLAPLGCRSAPSLADALDASPCASAVQPATLRRKIAFNPNQTYVGDVDLVHDVGTWFDGEYP